MKLLEQNYCRIISRCRFGTEGSPE